MTTKKLLDNRGTNPIPDLDSVTKLRNILRGKPRDLLLFDLAIQTGMNINRLITLKVKDLSDLPAPDLRSKTFTWPGPLAETSTVISV